MLSPCGTEAEGASVFKVYPYTYCFLNGHRDTQLPSLNCIVAARRRLLKVQKSAKVVLVRPASFCHGSLGDRKVLTYPQIAGTSPEDSTLALSQGQENEESIRLIKISADYSGGANNLEGYRTDKLNLNGELTGPSKEMEINKATEQPSRTSPVEYATTLMGIVPKSLCSRHKGKPCEDLTDPGLIWRIDRREKFDVPGEDLPGFNPRDPNLPIMPAPEAEKVDLRHQMIDDRRNSEEWMIDYALRQVVSKLTPARKKRVELPVGAFEKVMPVLQFETKKSSSTGITHGRPIQACN